MPFPREVDVLLASPLVVTLSGVVDHVKVSSQDISISAVASHLVRYLESNASQLGLDVVSNIYIDEDDGLPKLTLTPSRPPSGGPRPPHATLVSIGLHYIWRRIAYKPSECVESCHETPFDNDLHPFSARLLLPVISVLNDAIERFASLHLIKRYPLIFGPLCKKLDLEATFFPPIFHSIFSVMEHSPDALFRKRCKRLVKTIVQQHSLAYSKSLSALSTYFASIRDDLTELSEMMSDERTVPDDEALHLSMEHLYRTRIRNPNFKSFLGTGPIDSDTEDDLSQAALSALGDDGSPELDWFQPSWNEPMLYTLSGAAHRSEANNDWSDDQGFWSAEEDPWAWSSPTLQKDIDGLLTNTWNPPTDSTGSMEHSVTSSSWHQSAEHVDNNVDQDWTNLDQNCFVAAERQHDIQNPIPSPFAPFTLTTRKGLRKCQYGSQDLAILDARNPEHAEELAKGNGATDAIEHPDGGGVIEEFGAGEDMLLDFEDELEDDYCIQ